MTSPIITSRLSLTAYEAADEADFIAFASTPGVLDFSSTSADPAALKLLFERAMALRAQPSERFSIWKITLAGRYIGHAELKTTASCAADELEIVYFFLPPYWGQGFASEICPAILARAWELGCAAVIATVDAEHPASLRVLEKSGFSERQELHDDESAAYLCRIRRPAQA